MVGTGTTAGSEHSGLYALLKIAERAIVGTGFRAAGGHGAVYFVGISVTSASAVLFGHPIWNPILLIGAFISRCCIYRPHRHSGGPRSIEYWSERGFAINDFSNLYPRLISFRTGGLITGFLGWRCARGSLLATPDAYIFGWLVGYSGLLGRSRHHGCGLLSDSQDRA